MFTLAYEEFLCNTCLHITHFNGMYFNKENAYKK